MADLAVQNITRAGLNPTLTAAAGGGDKFVNTGAEFLYINNASVAPITLTLVMQLTVDGQAITNRTVVIPAGGFRLVGPFPTNQYNDAQQKVNLTYSGVTTLTVGVLACPAA